MRWLIIFFIVSIIASCDCASWGDNQLGNNLSLFEGDRLEDRVIVLCPEKSKDYCYGGSYIIPFYEEHMVNGKYNEYVKSAISNKQWTIVRTIMIKSQIERYWIIDMNFNPVLTPLEIRENNIEGPMDYNTFKKEKTRLDISLSFENHNLP